HMGGRGRDVPPCSRGSRGGYVEGKARSWAATPVVEEGFSMKTSTRIGTGAVAAVAALATGIPMASAAPAAPPAPAQATVATAHASAPVITLAWPVLREGKNAAWPPATVRSLQYLLNAHGARLAVDGAFGPRTKAAVVTFQRAHRLP